MWVQLHNLPIEIPTSTTKSIVFEVGTVIECTLGKSCMKEVISYT